MIGSVRLFLAETATAENTLRLEDLAHSGKSKTSES